ncbi:MAG: hypothetical protein ACJARE_003092 [Paracoccaceae bacterium]|jgi:hypothetical protein
MTDENPDATKATNHLNLLNADIITLDDIIAAGESVSRRSLPPPAASAAGAPVAAASRAAMDPIKVGASRDEDKKRVVVDGKAQVRAVFANLGNNYTVKGYGERSRKGFGDFFLGMDAGPERDSQSHDINKAIQSITAEEGFTLGLKATRAAYDTLDDEATNDRTWLEQVSDTFKRAPMHAFDAVSSYMVAAVTKDLFGIPDGELIVTAPSRSNLTAPSCCPYDFKVVSASLFKPDPDPDVVSGGPYLGQLLAKQTATLVARLRAAKTPPPGRLMQVLFDKIPPVEDDRLVRTLIGTMMGLLPTIDGNLIEVMNGLQKNGEIPGLKAKIADMGTELSYDHVRDLLKPAVYKAMQQIPVPEAVWRIAAHDHVISGEKQVVVKKGDMVVVDIASATNADLKDNIADVSAIFGGLRTGKGKRPTHACPGYEMAMGIIYGAVAVMLQRA